MNLPQRWEMKRNTMVSLLAVALGLALQPVRAQTVETKPYPADSGYSSVSESSLVRAVQVALQKAGYYVGNTEGKYTSDTRAAVSRFQRDKGLSETGTITESMLQALGLG